MATEAGDIFVRVRADMGDFNRGMGQVEGGLHRVRGALGGFARTAVRAGLVAGGALAVGLGTSVKVAADFERSMRNVNSIAKLNEKGFNDLGKSVLDMAGKVGQKPKVLADGLYDIVSSGFKASAAVKILRVSAKAATAGLTDTATASKAVTAALNAYGWGANKARAVSDVLFRTVDRGVLTFEELAQNMGDLVPIAAPLGVRLEEVGAAMSTLTLQGVPAAEAATRVKNVMMQLAKPSDDLAGLFREAGFASGEAAVQSLGFAGVLDLLSEATGGSVTEAAKLTPEIRSLMGVVGLTGKNLETYNENLRLMEQAQKGAGVTSQVFDEQSKSLSVQMQKLGATWDVLRVQAGTVLIPALRSAAEAVTRFLAALAKADGFRAKLNIIWEGMQDVAEGAWRKIRAALGSIDWSDVWKGVRVRGEGLVKRINEALAKAPWDEVGKNLGVLSGIVSLRLTKLLVDAVRKIDWSDVAAGFAQGLGESLFGLDPKVAEILVQEFGRGSAAGALRKTMESGIAEELAKLNLPKPILKRAMKELSNLTQKELLAAIQGEDERELAIILANHAARGARGAKLPIRQTGVELGDAFTRAMNIKLERDLAPAITDPVQEALERGTIIGVPAAQESGKKIGGGLKDGAGWGLDGLAERMAAIAIAEIMAASAAIRGAFSMWSPSRVWRDRIGKPLGEGILLGAVNGLIELPDKLNEKIGQALDAARTKIDNARGMFSEAWSRLAGDALDAFDRKTQEVLERFDRTVGAIKTPAEKMLDALDKQDRVKSIADGIRNATKALAEARAELSAFNAKLDVEAGRPISGGALAGDAKKEQDRLKEAVLAAQDSLTSALRDKRRAALEDRAAVERANRDDYLTKLRREKEDELAIQRRSLGDALAAYETHFAKAGIVTSKAQAATIKLLHSFGIDFAKAGGTLGSAFVAGLKESLLGAAGQAGDLRGLIERIAREIKVPKFGAGGIVTRPTLAMIGERGPEAIIPLTGGSAGVGAAPLIVNITVKGSLIHERELGATVVRAAQDWSRVNGAILSRTPFAAA